MRGPARSALRDAGGRLTRVRIDVHHIDVFTEGPFSGNPAAVCPLEAWPDDATLRAVAIENHLPATAFFVPAADAMPIRWFRASGAELELCGHGLLAAASLALERLTPERSAVRFTCAPGALAVRRAGDTYAVELPARPAAPAAPPQALIDALGAHAHEWRKAGAWLAVFAAEDDVRALRPDSAALAAFDPLIATAPGDASDFVSRYFAPRYGAAEDAATGSAHLTLAPYWARRLGRARLHARQLSARGGTILCEDRGDQVTIAGRTVHYMEGRITLP